MEEQDLTTINDIPVCIIDRCISSVDVMRACMRARNKGDIPDSAFQHGLSLQSGLEVIALHLREDLEKVRALVE